MDVYQLRVQTSNLTFRNQLYSSSSISNNVTSETNNEEIHRATKVSICLCWGLTAQSTQWGHVERSQFT